VRISFTGISAKQTDQKVLKKLPEKSNLTTSIIIPCHSKHAIHLPKLLNYLKNQTVLPNEVVISISESKNVDDAIKLFLKDTDFPFLLKPIYSMNKVSAGGNRNIAASNATGDLIICNDADDFPHCQRVEVIKHYFENYDIDVLIHSYFIEDMGFDKIFLDIDSYDVYPFNKIPKNIKVHTGCPALKKNVFSSIKWVDKFISYEDTIFIKEARRKFKNVFFINAEIYEYNNQFSSYRNSN
jgi:hypothetical protein